MLGSVHQLEHRGSHHRAHRDHGVRGLADGPEAGDDGGLRGLGRHEPQDRAGDDAEGALAADEQLEQRQPGHVLDALAAQRDQGAVGEHDVEAEHVVGGDAVLHAAQAAGVGRDVAADRADLERRRVGRVPEAVLGRRPLDVGVERAGLGDGHLARRVDLDGVHPLQAEHQTPVDRRRSAGQPTAGTSRHDADVVRRRPPHRGLHVLGALGAHHRQRHPGRLVLRPVEAVLLHRVDLGHHDASGQGCDQVSDGCVDRCHAAHATTLDGDPDCVRREPPATLAPWSSSATTAIAPDRRRCGTGWWRSIGRTWISSPRP